MKRLYKTITLLPVALLLHSCFSLDQEPYQEASQENLIQNVGDAQMALNGIYATLRNQHQGECMYATDIQADFLNMAITANPEFLPELHCWTDFSTSNETTARIWRNKFLLIQNINIFLEAFQRLPQEPALESLKGQLYLSRAFCYAYLATHYCQAYDTQNAATQLGLPLTERPVVKNFPQRSSLKETYEFILADIVRAEPLLTTTVTTDLFSQDAAKALKARVLLYQNKWEEAYAVATDLIDAARYPLVQSAFALAAIWTDDATAESITQLHASATAADGRELPLGVNDIYINSKGNTLQPKFIPTQTFVDLFDNADRRKRIFFRRGEIAGHSFYMLNKYPNNELLKRSDEENETYRHLPKLLRIAETYLIAAEAAYRKGDTSNAQKYLNALRQSRGLAAVALTGEPLWTEIQNERNRELCFEGFRLIDLKRWGLGVVRGTPQQQDLIIKRVPAQFHELNIAPSTANYYKIVWPIPASDIDFEQGKWKNNLGW